VSDLFGDHEPQASDRWGGGCADLAPRIASAGDPPLATVDDVVLTIPAKFKYVINTK
jgi:hypothetical protein